MFLKFSMNSIPLETFPSRYFMTHCNYTDMAAVRTSEVGRTFEMYAAVTVLIL
jgi:hypothetical protein